MSPSLQLNFITTKREMHSVCGRQTKSQSLTGFKNKLFLVYDDRNVDLVSAHAGMLPVEPQSLMVFIVVIQT